MSVRHIVGSSTSLRCVHCPGRDGGEDVLPEGRERDLGNALDRRKPVTTASTAIYTYVRYGYGMSPYLGPELQCRTLDWNLGLSVPPPFSRPLSPRVLRGSDLID